MRVGLEEFVHHAAEFAFRSGAAELPHVGVGHRLVVMENDFVILESVVAEAGGDGVGVIPVVAGAGGVVVAARHLDADEIGQLLGVVQRVVARLVDDFFLLDGIGRRRRNVDWLGRRRRSNRQDWRRRRPARATRQLFWGPRPGSANPRWSGRPACP